MVSARSFPSTRKRPITHTRRTFPQLRYHRADTRAYETAIYRILDEQGGLNCNDLD
jgi:hypothetical protein